MNNRHHQTSLSGNNNRSTDLENAIPLFQQTITGSNMGPIKPNHFQPQQQQQLKTKGGDPSAPSGQKRKALVDITNTQKGNQQLNNQLQPAKKKVKSNPIQVFNDNPTNSKHQLPPQPIKPKNMLSQSLNRKNMVVSSRPTLKLSTFDDDNEIEYCPQAEEIMEHPIPIFTEFNLISGKAEDIFVTLSDERMKEITKPPISKPGSFLSFDVINSITSCAPSSPSPQPLSPISFDDIFNFDVL